MSKFSTMTPPRNMDKIKQETRERRRNILYLILGYLRENLLEQTADTLTREAQLTDNFELCENVELDVVLQEYQSYYCAKFQKYPKIVRKVDGSVSKQCRSAKRSPLTTPAPPREKAQEIPSESDDNEFQFEIISLQTKSNSPKPRPEFDQYTSENKELIKQVSGQMITNENIGVKWSDCLGLDGVIEILKESIIYPVHYPEIFQGTTSWKGVLLHGPPGTGKTLLAKALASESNTTFFNVTSSAIISKWRGESEKLIKHLFDMAKLHAPSTIFFDEIDALVCSEHEASKRFKSELLVQLDGVPSALEGQLFVLASTNSPWELDGALLRRFDKRILVDMPSKDARINILKHNLNCQLSSEDEDKFGGLTESYSGCDIRNICKEVGMKLVRERIKIIEKGGKRKEGGNRIIKFEDLKGALDKIRPSTSSLICKKYCQWQNEHGAL